MTTGVANAVDKDGDLTQALPEGAGTRLAVMFSPEDATALGDQPNDRVQGGNLLGVGCGIDPPLFGGEDAGLMVAA